MGCNRRADSGGLDLLRSGGGGGAGGSGILVVVMTVILAVGVMVLLAVFLGLRVLLGKDDEVRKPGCANANAFMDEQQACPVCGVEPGQTCANEEYPSTTAAGAK